MATDIPNNNNLADNSPETPTEVSYSHVQQIELSQHLKRAPSPPDLKSTENRLRPAGDANKVFVDIINHIIWDESFNPDNYVIVFLDRFEGELELSFAGWKKESTDEEFIPQHRVLYIRHINGDVVWDRRRRIDTIFNSGNSAFSELAFLN
ncbi:uncharacterized protein N7483_006451 [Penicillium malachiteum]|uniref:uncharacterized protein n=1 Tax=Penicillium malachiteum TaxID=1324776 RepID=UPI002547FB77|nr:uncharacterized protein N7483_006451 [Penicillium malachiteum]KAJ5725094.1 hypothetical protein N7483_006451 [Penicillium malachiteum]